MDCTNSFKSISCQFVKSDLICIIFQFQTRMARVVVLIQGPFLLTQQSTNHQVMNLALLVRFFFFHFAGKIKYFPVLMYFFISIYLGNCHDLDYLCCIEHSIPPLKEYITLGGGGHRSKPKQIIS